jgi:hypothetical protein
MADAQFALNMGFSTDDIRAHVSQELQWAIMRILAYHVGADHRICGGALMAEMRAEGFQQSERTVRMAISEMRRTLGIPIAGTGGINGGYWMLKDQKEADEYCAVELHDRGLSLLEQESSIRKAAADWYPNGQLRLPG